MKSSDSGVLNAYALVVMGLKELGIIEDPFIKKYRNADKLLSEGGEEGMSISGLASLANGRFCDGEMPHRGSSCHIPIYGLKPDGWKKFQGSLEKLVEEGIFTKEAAAEIMRLPKYQEKVCQ